MSTANVERRKKRSSDPLVALHYQLSVARSEGDLDTIVLADPSGVVVAGAGSWAACEEIAAYAPLLASAGSVTSSAKSAFDGRIGELHGEISITPVNVTDETTPDVLLCIRTSKDLGTFGADVARGIRRILRAA